jgi:peptide/nickel transport system permease protein
MDERELDPRLSPESRAAIRGEYQSGCGLLTYYVTFLRKAVHGDFGNSTFLQQPVAELLRQRVAFTLRVVLLGLLTGWIVATVGSLLAIRFQHWLLELAATSSTGILIALPTGVVALLCVYLRAPLFLGIAAVTLPKLFRYQYNLFAHVYGQPFILALRSRGVSTNRIVLHHVVPLSWQPILALLGVSLTMALGAAIPLEALSDSPGVGQLAWQAALNRDLPLLTTITLFVTLLTVAVNSLTGTVSESQS